MTKGKAEIIEKMIMKELCRESLTDLLDYWEVSLSELEQFMEQAKSRFSRGLEKKMTKKTRELVYQKYNGRCAYCGHEITIKEMQVDHIVPQRLGGADIIENYNPSCRICNHYKRATRLEIWRAVLLDGLINRIKQIYIVKVAERYGMITFHEWDKKFYFEREIKE